MPDKFAFNPKLTLGWGYTDPEEGTHTQEFGIKHRGKEIGFVDAELHHLDPKNVHINDIGLHNNEGKNKLGPGHVRNLARQIKKFYPKTETLSGFRVSGARRVGGRVPQPGEDGYVKVKI